MRTAQSLVFTDLAFRYVRSKKPQLGLIVSKKYGNAVQRNLFKRRCRSIFNIHIIKHNINYFIIIKPKINNLTFSTINKRFLAVCDALSS